MSNQRRAAGAYRKVQGLIKATDSGGASAGDATRSAPNGAPRPGESPPPTASAATRGESPPARESIRTVAQFLALVGRREAAAILKRMPREEADRVVDALSRLGPISQRDARRVLAQFGSRRERVTHAAAAGPDTAREILVRAFGTEEGERRFYEVLPEERPARFAFLADADGKQLTMMLRGESAATLATIASHVPQKTAARLLEALPAASKIEVVRRMATIQSVDATVLDAIESSLRRRMESIERPDAEEARIDGEERLAEILRYLDMHTSDAILTSLTHSSPDTAEHIRDRMTTLDDLLLLTDKDLQTVLARVDDVDLAVALKGASAPVVERISTNLSDRRREMVEMHRASFGPMHRRDVDRITADLVELVRQAAREGEIVIRSAGEEYV